MSTSTPTTSGKSQEAPMVKLDAAHYEKYIPKSVELESATGAAKTGKIWSDIYSAVGASTESSRMSVRCAVYVYGALNGTSSVGNYKSKIKTSEGTEFDASVIIGATGNSIRKFFRANMEEVYTFFKISQVMARHGSFVAKAQKLGVSAEDCFVIADFFVNCPYFTPSERRAHDIATNYSLKRASTARGGKTIEDIDSEVLEERLDSQAPNGVRGKPISWN